MISKFLGFQTVCLLAGLAKLASTQDAPISTNVGSIANPGEFPYMASIRVNDSHQCGGAIISEMYILSTAHCIQPLLNSTSNVEVVTGTNHIQDGGVTHQVDRMYYHPQYSPDNATFYDIGVIKLSSPIDFDATQTSIPIATQPTPANSVVTVSGWGTTENGEPSVWLQKSDEMTLETSECERLLGNVIDDSIMCTTSQKHESTCIGDMGSPVVGRGQVAGLASGGYPCVHELPNMNTNVYTHRNYINSIVNQS